MTLAADILDAAQYYLNLGLKVIALTDKMPNVKVHPHGKDDAFVAPEEGDTDWNWGALRRAFGHPDTSGVGILTTWPLVVVDIDGEEGARAWKALAGDEFMPDRWVAKTGRGLHMYFFSTDKVGSMKLAPLLDLKGEGGYVAAPPSLHPDGHRYTWLLPPDERPMIEVPVRLRNLIERKVKEDAAWAQEHREFRAQSKRPLVDGVLFAVPVFDGIIKTMREAAEGERNNVLNWAAYTMGNEGADPEDMEELFATAISVGLTHREVRRTIRSALESHA